MRDSNCFSLYLPITFKPHLKPCASGSISALPLMWDSVKEQSLMTRTDIQQFVAKYLNAVRLQEEELQNWYQSLHQESEGNELKSACSECEHHQACHGGFAAVNNIGLYPFTPKALEEMLGRVNTGNFNPRFLIKDVLKWTLENSVDDIERGEFPSTSLREHFGKPKTERLAPGRY